MCVEYELNYAIGFHRCTAKNLHVMRTFNFAIICTWSQMDRYVNVSYIAFPMCLKKTAPQQHKGGHGNGLS